VFRENEQDDINDMVDNFTSPSLARALRERESTLQYAAMLIENDNYDELKRILKPFSKSSIDIRRKQRHNIDLSTTTGKSTEPVHLS
jgi:hypothetical protein